MTVIKGAVPMVEFQLQYIVKDMDLNSLEGRLQAMSKIIPVLLGLRNMAQRNAYVARAAQLLGVAENELRDELNRRGRNQGGYQPGAERQAIRAVRRQNEDANRRAGRVIIRAIWQEPAVLEHFVSQVPIDAVPDSIQAGILRQMAIFIKQGTTISDVMQFASLGDESVEEISRAMVEDTGGQDMMDLYQDCTRFLRKHYLKTQFEIHRLRAEQLSREGSSEFLEELEISQKIRKEMDEL